MLMPRPIAMPPGVEAGPRFGAKLRFTNPELPPPAFGPPAVPPGRLKLRLTPAPPAAIPGALPGPRDPAKLRDEKLGPPFGRLNEPPGRAKFPPPGEPARLKFPPPPRPEAMPGDAIPGDI